MMRDVLVCVCSSLAASDSSPSAHLHTSKTLNSCLKALCICLLFVLKILIKCSSVLQVMVCWFVAKDECISFSASLYVSRVCVCFHVWVAYLDSAECVSDAVRRDFSTRGHRREQTYARVWMSESNWPQIFSFIKAQGDLRVNVLQFFCDGGLLSEMGHTHTHTQKGSWIDVCNKNTVRSSWEPLFVFVLSAEEPYTLTEGSLNV